MFVHLDEAVVARWDTRDGLAAQSGERKDAVGLDALAGGMQHDRAGVITLDLDSLGGELDDTRPLQLVRNQLNDTMSPKTPAEAAAG